MYSQAILFCDGWVLCALTSLCPECLVQRNVYIQEIFVDESSLSSKRRWPVQGGCTLMQGPELGDERCRVWCCRCRAWWWDMQSLVMRDAELDAEWSWLSGSVKSSDCAQDFWRDEGSGMNVHVLPMCPRWGKVASSPWEEWGNRLSSSHGSCWHGDVGKMGSLMHAGISFNILVLLLFCLDL